MASGCDKGDGAGALERKEGEFDPKRPDVDDGSQLYLTKKRKDMENAKDEDSVSLSKRQKYEWNQTDEIITIRLFLDCNIDQSIISEFSKNSVVVKFPDGNEWTCKFSKDIACDGCKTEVSNLHLILTVAKKVAGLWSALEAESKSTASCTESAEDSEMYEDNEKKGEPVYQLQHIKHDWIEKTDTFIIHIYVKNINKDTVEVHYDKKLIDVKFQTSDSKFLSLHSNSTADTVFCWKINIKNDIVPASCRHKIKNMMIEVIVAKKNPVKWGALEAPQKKETPLSRSACWISTGKSMKSEVNSCSVSESKVTFDELNSIDISGDNRNFGDNLISLNKEPGKPTCKVSPMNKNKEAGYSVLPGFTGLDNLGNTCFLNSVLQALSNNREFRDYFISDCFQREINSENPLGSGGKLAVSFAVLCKVLWSGKHISYAPSMLKNHVAMKASQFTGFAQHDAQEFMAFLLDILHEDLNRVKKKPYTQTVDSDGRADEVVANEAWDIYKKRNDSFIVDKFQGQYKSKLVCPVCGKVSITFDPFLYLSVPLPKKQRLLPVILIRKEPYIKPVQYMLRLSKDATVEVLKEKLSKKAGIKPRDLRIFEAYKSKIHEVFSRGSDLSHVRATDAIIACEVLSEEMAGEAVYEIFVIQRTIMPNVTPSRCSYCKKTCQDGIKLKRCTKCYKVGYCDQECQRNHWHVHKGACRSIPEPVGYPFIISMPASRATFARICKLMEAYSRYSVDVFQPPVKTDSPSSLTGKTSSNLSSSSQSSGSLNSLDSQSSYSSACTLTAADDDEQQQNLRDADSEISFSLPPRRLSSESISLSENLDSEFSELYDCEPLQPKADCLTSPGDKMTKHVRTNAVLGLQTVDAEQVPPLFFIKPVNQDGIELTGPAGEQLEDKGDEPLDLKNKTFLAMDWKNNNKWLRYVLVQSKHLEYDDDESMMTETIEENSDYTLDQCLSLFTEPEVLSPDEAWYCPRCKDHREATKQLSIWRLPCTLIIQLKRFSFRNFIWRDKIDKMVDFPIRGLDMSRYYMGSKPHHEVAPIYDLYAVINHHGGILGGHYTSFVRCADKNDSTKNEVDWRLCDDSHVTSYNEKNVVTRSAYLLFYHRRNIVHAQESGGGDESLKASKEPSKLDELPELEICSKTELKLDNLEDTPLENKSSYTDMDAVD